MQALNLLKRVLGIEPQYSVSNNVVEKRPKEYMDMIYELSKNFARDGHLHVVKCNDEGKINFNQEEFISLVLKDENQVLDFFRKYFYVGNTRSNKLDENLLDFRFFADDLINCPPYKWVYINDLVNSIVSDQRFKNMQLSGQITKILLNKERDEMIGKIEQVHALNAISLMVEHNIFEDDDLKQILRVMPNGHYNKAEQSQIRNNLLVNIISKYNIENDVYNAILAGKLNENFFITDCYSGRKGESFADLWKRLQNIKMIPSNLVAQAILDVDDFASENILTIQDVKTHYPNVLIDLCVISKKETAMPNFKYCKDYRNIKDFIKKYATAFSDIDLSESIEKIVSLVDGDKDKADRKVIAFDIFDSIGNKSNLSLSVPTKVRLSEYLLLEKRECLEDSFWKKIIEEVSCELDESCEFLKFTVDDQNLIRKNKASIEKGHIKEAIQDLGIETETPKRKI